MLARFVFLSAAAYTVGICAAEPHSRDAASDRAPAGGWKLADLSATMESLPGRSFDRGRALFERQHCATCHPTDDVRLEFGPDLTKLDPRFQPLDILRDILEPSRRIADLRYDLWMFETDWGRQVSGLIRQETNQAVTVMEQPRSKTPPVVLKQSEIVARKMSLMSIMPERMLDGLTRDEVADLIAYVAARGDPQSEYVRPAKPVGEQIVRFPTADRRAPLMGTRRRTDGPRRSSTASFPIR